MRGLTLSGRLGRQRCAGAGALRLPRHALQSGAVPPGGRTALWRSPFSAMAAMSGTATRVPQPGITP